ncbi:preprotein translocase subunit SecG [Henriciella marina]|jgi:preprotein translocase subunit SecG|uniref:Protein-export membrane protein SecG n=1 Tax=Henriciella marina TaxID=453851 RepID=A0ABT4LXJ0_9PROT|nr:preprotein translocase subunit SecG [Henriciella marina]MCZ4299098.1 preprotein translocase subunit SecG [Henriciella marina]
MTVILVIHILASLVLVGVVLMQRSEGGALGVGGGGGGGGGGLMSGRGAAGALVRTTIIFGAIFFITSLVLTTITTRNLGDQRTDVERALDDEFGGSDAGGFDLDDPTSPLLDDDPVAMPSQQDAEPVLPETERDTSDPLAADVPADIREPSGVETEQGEDTADAPTQP